jgi:hypothetical protein
MEWVASTLHTTSKHCVSSITTADAHTSAAPADLNGIVLFAERRNLDSARVPSHFKRSLPAGGSGTILKNMVIFTRSETK